MKFSVLMSLYFKETPQYLAESLQSLVEQTYPADEIVLVFDGKLTPELEQVVQNFSEILPVVVVRLEQNQGLGKALNHGLIHCKNEWVFRMDTDDICVPERFAKQVEFIQANPDCVIFGGQIAEFGTELNDIISYRLVPTTHNELVAFTKVRCPFNHMTVAYRKDVVLACGGYEDLQEDYYLWLKLVANAEKQGQKIANLDDILVYARVGNGMVSRRRGLPQAKAEWRLFRLKVRLDLQNQLNGFATFLMRAIPRLLPVSALKFVYQFTRR